MNIDDIREKADKLIDSLPNTRKERVLRQKDEDEKLRLICAQLLIDKFVDGEISVNEYGKPVTSGGGYFNISHDGKYVVFVKGDVPIGIDIVEIGRVKPKILKRICCEEERKIIGDKRLSDEELAMLWSRKESVMKADGRGIRLSANSFCVLPFERERIKADGNEYEVETEVFDGYALTVARQA